MKQLLMAWLKYRRPITILGSSCEDSIISIQYLDYLGSDRKFYSLGVAYTPTKILGYNSTGDSTLRLVGNVEDNKPVDLFHLLDSLVMCYENKEDWMRSRNKKINRTSLERGLKKQMDNLMTIIGETECGPFKVVGTQQTGLLDMVVSYVYRGRIQLPFSISLGETSLVKLLDYGEDSELFMEFIRKIKIDVVFY